jgi:hypothetical protein
LSRLRRSYKGTVCRLLLLRDVAIAFVERCKRDHRDR